MTLICTTGKYIAIDRMITSGPTSRLEDKFAFVNNTLYLFSGCRDTAAQLVILNEGGNVTIDDCSASLVEVNPNGVINRLQYDKKIKRIVPHVIGSNPRAWGSGAPAFDAYVAMHNLDMLSDPIYDLDTPSSIFEIYKLAGSYINSVSPEFTLFERPDNQDYQLPYMSIKRWDANGNFKRQIIHHFENWKDFHDTYFLGKGDHVAFASFTDEGK